MSENNISGVMDAMPYGLYIIGSNGDGEANGMMADWVMQVSFEPRLIAVALENDAHTLQNIRRTGVFTINALSQDGESMELAAKFAQPYFDAKITGRAPAGREKVHHKLVGVPHTARAAGPVLDGAMAWLECEAVEFVPTGDHTLVVARVREAKLVREAQTLTSTYTGWNYSG